jgi:hypothetical protein
MVQERAVQIGKDSQLQRIRHDLSFGSARHGHKLKRQDSGNWAIGAQKVSN